MIGLVITPRSDAFEKVVNTTPNVVRAVQIKGSDPDGIAENVCEIQHTINSRHVLYYETYIRYRGMA